MRLCSLSTLFSSAAEADAHLMVPQSSRENRVPGAWTAHTSLAERALRGSKTVVVRDCQSVQVGGRIRISVGSAEEEEGSVASIRCLSPGMARSPTILSESPCDLTALAWTQSIHQDGEGGVSSSHVQCQRLLEVAKRAPALADSYRSARQSSSKMRGGSPVQPESLAALTGSADAHRTIALVLPTGTPAAGLLTLVATTLFDHSPDASVHASAAISLDGHEKLVVQPPVKSIVPGSVATSATNCSRHGQLNGTSCACVEGYAGSRCQRKSCPDDCSSHGICLNGTCMCASGWRGTRCDMHSQAACPDACGGVRRGTCALSSAGGSEPLCLCNARFFGATCLTTTLDCGTKGCGGNGQCVSDNTCQCYAGFSGDHCETTQCLKNCTTISLPNGMNSAHGRCSSDVGCICKDGFSGSDCAQECPNRCHGHGECQDGICACRQGYTDYDCSKVALQTPLQVFEGGLSGYYPVVMVALLALMLLTLACILGYVVNRWRGRFGTAAVPLWEYYAKTWRNAPLFEPIFAVSAATQTPPPPSTMAHRHVSRTNVPSQ